MRKPYLALLLFILILFSAAFWWTWRYYFQFGVENSLKPGEPVVVVENMQLATASAKQAAQSSVPYKVEPFISNLSVPWSLVFTSPTRILVNERPGRVRVVENGVLQSEPIRTFPEVSTQSEEGLMGMVMDPNYDENHFIYICVAYEKDGTARDKIVRVVDTGIKLENDVIIMDNIPAARFHAGCRIRFGPDGKLYISTGDATDKKNPQDLQSLGGKMLRINSDGSFPADNPFSNSAVYSYGHRNPQGFDWNPRSGTLVETEHGPSGNDGPGGGDEVNVIQKGQNYGWPVVSHEKTHPEMISPSLIFTPAVAPASGMFYRGSVFPQFTNTFLFGLLRGEGIIQVVFSEQNPERITSYQKITGIDVGRVRDIVEGPDGYIYFTTSNTDGRGKPKTGDDKIYRILPL